MKQGGWGQSESHFCKECKNSSLLSLLQRGTSLKSAWMFAWLPARKGGRLKDEQSSLGDLQASLCASAKVTYR